MGVSVGVGGVGVGMNAPVAPVRRRSQFRDRLGSTAAKKDGEDNDDGEDDDDDDDEEALEYAHHHHRFLAQLYKQLNSWGFVTDSNTKDHDGMLQIPRAEAILRMQTWFNEPFENGPELRALLARLSSLPPPKMFLRHEGQAGHDIKHQDSHRSFASERVGMRQAVDPDALLDLDDFVAEVMAAWSEQAIVWSDELLERFQEEARWFQQRRNGLFYEVDPVRAVAAAEAATIGEVSPVAVVDFRELQRVMRKIVLLSEREVAELFLMGTQLMQEKTVAALVEEWVSFYVLVDERMIGGSGSSRGDGKGRGGGEGEEEEDDTPVIEEFVEYDSDENELLEALLGDDGKRYVQRRTGRHQKLRLQKAMEDKLQQRRRKQTGRAETGVQILKAEKKQKRRKKHGRHKHDQGAQTIGIGDVPTRYRVWRRCYCQPESKAVQWESPFSKHLRGPSVGFDATIFTKLMMGKAVMQRSHTLQFRLESAHSKLGGWIRKRLAAKFGKDAMLRKRWGDTAELAQGRVFDKGEEVMARYEGLHKFLAGTIAAVHDNEDSAGPTYDVDFDNGESQSDILWSNIRRVDNSEDEDEVEKDATAAAGESEW
jgi:hypothetical protein